jgi:hypothetical protein
MPRGDIALILDMVTVNHPIKITRKSHGRRGECFQGAIVAQAYFMCHTITLWSPLDPQIFKLAL